MRLIVLTPPGYYENETLLVNRMFENNLPLLHLRKPGYDREHLRAYLKKIDRAYRSGIVIHSGYELAEEYGLRGIHIKGSGIRHKDSIISRYESCDNLSISISCHSLEELESCSEKPDYSFLSPVFDSISKSGYKAGFEYDDLEDILKKVRIDTVALGGCNAGNISKVKDLGFSGAAFLGAVWNSSDPVKSFINIYSACP